MHDDLSSMLVHSLSSMSGPGCMPLQVSTETYGRAAEVEVTGDIQCIMPYIPSHLDYMLYELLKNAHRCMCVWSCCRPLKLCCVSTSPCHQVSSRAAVQASDPQLLRPAACLCTGRRLLCRLSSAQLLQYGRPAVLPPVNPIGLEQRIGCCCRAVAEHYPSDKALPVIELRICQADHEVNIR